MKGFRRHRRDRDGLATLDFGCGLGRLTRALALHLAEVWGVDLWSRMIQPARASHRDVSSCSFERIGETIPFPGGRVDPISPIRTIAMATCLDLVTRDAESGTPDGHPGVAGGAGG
jgi:ubiquinone/menaquinone biosynthesis C-methylase UbiE